MTDSDRSMVLRIQSEAKTHSTSGLYALKVSDKVAKKVTLSASFACVEGVELRLVSVELCLLTAVGTDFAETMLKYVSIGTFKKSLPRDQLPCAKSWTPSEVKIMRSEGEMIIELHVGFFECTPRSQDFTLKGTFAFRDAAGVLSTELRVSTRFLVC